MTVEYFLESPEDSRERVSYWEAERLLRGVGRVVVEVRGGDYSLFIRKKVFVLSPFIEKIEIFEVFERLGRDEKVVCLENHPGAAIGMAEMLMNMEEFDSMDAVEID